MSDAFIMYKAVLPICRKIVLCLTHSYSLGDSGVTVQAKENYNINEYANMYMEEMYSIQGIFIT
jgi:hypothetical protein